MSKRASSQQPDLSESSHADKKQRTESETEKQLRIEYVLKRFTELHCKRELEEAYGVLFAPDGPIHVAQQSGIGFAGLSEETSDLVDACKHLERQFAAIHRGCQDAKCRCKKLYFIQAEEEVHLKTALANVSYMQDLLLEQHKQHKQSHARLQREIERGLDELQEAKMEQEAMARSYNTKLDEMKTQLRDELRLEMAIKGDIDKWPDDVCPICHVKWSSGTKRTEHIGSKKCRRQFWENVQKKKSTFDINSLDYKNAYEEAAKKHIWITKPYKKYKAES